MRKLGMLVVCAAVAAVVSGCGSGGDAAQPADGQAPDAAKEKVIGAALLTQTHIFYQDMIAEMREEAARRGFKLKTQFAEFDSRRQNDQMEMFIAQGVDAIILAPTDSSGITPVVADARAKGIPVSRAVDGPSPRWWGNLRIAGLEQRDERAIPTRVGKSGPR